MAVPPQPGHQCHHPQSPVMPSDPKCGCGSCHGLGTELGTKAGTCHLPLPSSLALNPSPAGHGLGKGQLGTCSPESARTPARPGGSALTQSCGSHRDTLAVPMPPPASFGQDPSPDSTWHRIPRSQRGHVPAVYSLGTCPQWGHDGFGVTKPLFPRCPWVPRSLCQQGLGTGMLREGPLCPQGCHGRGRGHCPQHLVPHPCIHLYPSPLPTGEAQALEAVTWLVVPGDKGVP